MTNDPVCLRLAPDSLLHDLRAEALKAVQTVDGELELDFSAIVRLDAGAVRALEELAGIADQRAVRIVLRDVNLNVYKTLTLLKLAGRFKFAG